MINLNKTKRIFNKKFYMMDQINISDNRTNHLKDFENRIKFSFSNFNKVNNSNNVNSVSNFDCLNNEDLKVNSSSEKSSVISSTIITNTKKNNNLLAKNVSQLKSKNKNKSNSITLKAINSSILNKEHNNNEIYLAQSRQRIAINKEDNMSNESSNSSILLDNYSDNKELNYKRCNNKSAYKHWRFDENLK